MSLLTNTVAEVAKNGDDFWAAVILTAHRGGIVYLDADRILIAQRESEDTYFLWLVMGPGVLPKLCELAPPETKWLKWQRGFRLADKAKVAQYPFERVKRLVSHHEPQTPQDGCAAGERPAARDVAVGELG